MTIINTGWTPPELKASPANKAQLAALLESIGSKPYSQERENARFALMASLEALDALAAKEERGPKWTPAVFAAGEDYDATPCPA